MSTARLRKAEAILSKLRARHPPPSGAVIFTRGATHEEHQADEELQRAALREKGFDDQEGTLFVIPVTAGISPAPMKPTVRLI